MLKSGLMSEYQEIFNSIEFKNLWCCSELLMPFHYYRLHEANLKVSMDYLIEIQARTTGLCETDNEGVQILLKKKKGD